MLIAGIHLHVTNPLPYLVVGYSLFWLVIFAYVVSLSLRQHNTDAELAVLRAALQERVDLGQRQA